MLNRRFRKCDRGACLAGEDAQDQFAGCRGHGNTRRAASGVVPSEGAQGIRLIDTGEGDHATHRIAHQVSAEGDLHIVGTRGRVDQLPDLDPSIIRLCFRIDVGEENAIVGDGGYGF